MRVDEAAVDVFFTRFRGMERSGCIWRQVAPSSKAAFLDPVLEIAVGDLLVVLSIGSSASEFHFGGFSSSGDARRGIAMVAVIGRGEKFAPDEVSNCSGRPSVRRWLRNREALLALRVPGGVRQRGTPTTMGGVFWVRDCRGEGVGKSSISTLMPSALGASGIILRTSASDVADAEVVRGR